MEANTRPLYEADQVVTYVELAMMREGIVLQYSSLRWYQWIQKIKFRSAAGVIDAQLIWMRNGKPVVRMHKGA
jgi:hypothetical protein